MELVSGESPWPAADSPPNIAEPLTEDVQTDVAVIGAGVTGALIADALSENGIEVVVVDRRELGEGSTQASTALLQYDLDVPLFELTEMTSRERAARAFLLGLEAIDRLEDAAQGIDCGFARRRSLYIASGQHSARDLFREFQARFAIGLPVSFAAADRLKAEWGLNAAAAIVSKFAAQVDPVRFTFGLLRRAKRRGVSVFENVGVAEIEENDRAIVHSNRGPSIQARWVVHAGGYEAANLAPAGTVELTSTFAFQSKPITSPQGVWTDRSMLWEFAEPYLYARWMNDRIMVGGEDVPVSSGCEELLPAKCETLLRKFAAWMPSLKLEVDSSWCGPIASTRDGLGFIGPIREASPILLALCYGGNGTVHAAAAAQIIADHIHGKRNSDAELFRVRRFD